MTIPLAAKFLNQVYLPTKEFIKTCAQYPLAIEPESNKLLHTFEGIVLHANHFAEKNGIKIVFESQFRDLANSIKHVRSNPSSQTEIISSIIYECRDNKFRFIKNIIEAKYTLTGKKFDGVTELCNTVNSYVHALGIKTPLLSPVESIYPLYDWAVAYHGDEWGALTKSVNIQTVIKTDTGYIHVDPQDVRFVVFDTKDVGLDPTPFFPSDHSPRNE